MAALAAGRQLASAWGATLYAAVVVQDASADTAADSTSQLVTASSGPGGRDREIARGGADRIVVAVTDVPALPLWSAIGNAWLAVVEHLRPRLVLFGADAPSALELGPRTAARIGAQLLLRARVSGLDRGPHEAGLRERDSGSVRIVDGGASVALIGGRHVVLAAAPRVEVLNLAAPGGSDPRVTVRSASAAPPEHTSGAIVVLSDDVSDDVAIARETSRIAALLAAPVVYGEPSAAITAELCVAVGSARVRTAGATSVVRVATDGTTSTETALVTGDVRNSLAALGQQLELE